MGGHKIIHNQRGIALVLELFFVAIVVAIVFFAGFHLFEAYKSKSANSTGSSSLVTSNYQPNQANPQKYQLLFYKGGSVIGEDELGIHKGSTSANRFLYSPDYKHEGVHLAIRISPLRSKPTHFLNGVLCSKPAFKVTIRSTNETVPVCVLRAGNNALTYFVVINKDGKYHLVFTLLDYSASFLANELKHAGLVKKEDIESFVSRLDDLTPYNEDLKKIYASIVIQ